MAPKATDADDDPRAGLGGDAPHRVRAEPCGGTGHHDDTLRLNVIHGRVVLS
ncbi:hypothetical protein PV416_00455 [Streptomyces ipomoeae]|jgi:hypothetical protein|uniref:hypothetical protein n=1 Tax=Streptomyces ipomoeae TaxID=103232 RepID=UPI0015F0498F|nr:hypothetical protein [Streptomyces ipomoeae]MDX2692814.1 hypothetical protein [Streptomyces ipomoeae]MDX2819593.1 hypothetical protein [Streptomyces ipomoeae]MDX2838362.1 hypothetical protein [Streptomyces ipomoeae]MDX2872688.1 hypothetical protein [Streptomyces ipomoeae]